MRTRRSWLRGWLSAACLPPAACFLQACRNNRPALPAYGAVPPFRLTASDGSGFDSRTLAGKPWLVSFFFTNCSGPCPRLNTALHQIQEETYRFPGLKMVSISIDPERDTPEALAAYARRYKADRDKWLFLTGPRETVNQLSSNVFKLGAIDASLTHSTRVMLVDGTAQVRGFYLTDQPEDLQALMQGIESIYQEKS